MRTSYVNILTFLPFSRNDDYSICLDYCNSSNFEQIIKAPHYALPSYVVFYHNLYGSTHYCGSHFLSLLYNHFPILSNDIYLSFSYIYRSWFWTYNWHFTWRFFSFFHFSLCIKLFLFWHFSNSSSCLIICILTPSFHLDDFNIVFRQQKNQPDFIFWLIFVSLCSIKFEQKRHWCGWRDSNPHAVGTGS